MEEIGIEGLRDLRKRLRFGDIVVNHWASEQNPHRVGIFVKIERYSLLVTDMKGAFWYPAFDHRAKIEIIGNIIEPHQYLKLNQ